ncbi:MAG: NFACT RNA binding domain-containing protein [Vicinamibacteria bacterium]
MLFIDVSRAAAGVWLLTRADVVPADSREVLGPSRSSALLFKKHLEGARIEAMSSTSTRLIALRTSRGEVWVRPFGAPGATLVVDGAPIAHFGQGDRVVSAGAGSPPEADPDPSLVARLVAEVRATARDARRLHLGDRDPGLLPLLRAWPESDATAARLAAVLSGDGAPQPFLAPPPGDDARNADSPPVLVPFEPDGDSVGAPDFTSAAGQLYVIQRRADLFRARAQSRLARAKAETARLSRLKAALDRDRGRWPDPAALRHHAEALLAAPPGVAFDPSGGRDLVTVEIPDPRTGDPFEVRLQPGLTLPQNANALYERARNIERQKTAFDKRWSSVISDLERAQGDLLSARAIRSLDELDSPEKGKGPGSQGGGSKSRYLTSRGLEILFGRSASENHDVTFKLAKREDIWFHVLDAPGGHVVLRNAQGRARREDIAEAATLAAFLSERRTEANVDVQYTERKHVHPAGGGKGRVRVTHAEVIRVSPLDPHGRLRAR